MYPPPHPHPPTHPPLFSGGNCDTAATYNLVILVISAPIMNNYGILGPNVTGKPTFLLFFQLCIIYFGVLHAYKHLPCICECFGKSKRVSNFGSQFGSLKRDPNPTPPDKKKITKWGKSLFCKSKVPKTLVDVFGILRNCKKYMVRLDFQSYRVPKFKKWVILALFSYPKNRHSVKSHP